MTIQANQGFGVSVFGAVSGGGGGSTSPGGSSGQIQYNASGSFAGMAGTSWDNTNRALTLTGATVTTSQPVLNLSQTWNAGAVTFTGLRFNATDTASASGSLLLDLQVGGVSQFSVSKGGSVTSPLLFSAQYMNASVALQLTSNTGVINFGVSADLIIRRAAAATLQLGAADAAAPVAQMLLIQSGSGTDINGVAFNIGGSKSTGTGTAGLVNIQTSSRGAVSGTSQNVLATVASFGPNTLSGSQAISLLDMAQTWNTSGAPIAIKLNVTDTASASGSLLLDLQTGGVSQLYITKAGSFYVNQKASFGGNTTIGENGSGHIVTRSAGILGFTSTTSGASVPDTILARDAANTLALRNGTNAQKFRVYNTYTSSTNYENFEIDWQTTANIALVGPTKGSGGGTQRVQRLQYLEDGGTGATTPLLGTTCPAGSATVKSWIKVITSDGTTAYIPCWA